MNEVKSGFTLLEVIFFLVVSSAIMAGVIAGTRTSVFKERYTDAVNTFAETIRGIYSSVTDVRNSSDLLDKPGRSNYAIYGKLVVIDGSAEIRVYSVVGKLSDPNVSLSDGSSAISAINALGANIVKEEKANPSKTYYRFYDEESYIIPWDATIEKPNGEYEKGLLLIVMSPISGIVNSYYADGSSPGSYTRRVIEATTANKDTMDNFKKALASGFSDGSGRETLISFCIDSTDNSFNFRRNVRVLVGAMNPSGVDIYSIADSGNQCLGNASVAGNRPGER